MQLTAEEVETAFVETAREQDGGEFDWNRCALHLNERLADNLIGRSRFMLRRDTAPSPSVGEDGAATKDNAR